MIRNCRTFLNLPQMFHHPFRNRFRFLTKIRFHYLNQSRRHFPKSNCCLETHCHFPNYHWLEARSA